MSSGKIQIEDLGETVVVRLVDESSGVNFVLIEVDASLAKSGNTSVLRMRDALTPAGANGSVQ